MGNEREQKLHVCLSINFKSEWTTLSLNTKAGLAHANSQIYVLKTIFFYVSQLQRQNVFFISSTGNQNWSELRKWKTAKAVLYVGDGEDALELAFQRDCFLHSYLTVLNFQKILALATFAFLTSSLVFSPYLPLSLSPFFFPSFHHF